MPSQCECGNDISIDERSELCRDCLQQQARASIDPEELRAELQSVV